MEVFKRGGAYMLRMAGYYIAGVDGSG